MKAYLIIYPSDAPSKERLRKAMDRFRLVEHISPKSSIVLTFRNEEEILLELNRENPENLPLLVVKIPGSVYTSHVPSDYMEPHNTEHL